MKKLRWAFASSLAGVLFAGTAMAQVNQWSPVQQPGSIQQMGFQSDDSMGYAAADAAPTPAPGAVAPAAPASPSNQPPAPPAAKAEVNPEAQKPKEEEKKPDEPAADDGPVKLFHGPWLDCEHLDIRGYMDVGYTDNPAWPLNHFNGPVGYNDRSDEFDLNQFYGIAERVAKVDNDCGVDYGYRADVMYGSDRRFVQVLPGSQWDSGWDNGNRFYGLAMPQLYGTLQYNKLTLLGGHFYAPCGYENAMPTENFFYSHTYSFLYGEPTTLTGGMATYKVNDRLTLNGGMDTGWNEFTDINGKPNFFLGDNWTSKDGKLNIVNEVFLGNTQTVPGDSFRYLFNTVATLKIGDKWKYATELNFGHDSFNAQSGGPATWNGWSNYLIYNINKCWDFGLRYEYFEDLNGAVVNQVGPPGVIEAGSKWNDVTVGLNWKPNPNVVMRSEVRWDWASNMAAPGAKPFDDGASNSQFLWGNDVVIRF